jgi:hypothetical protein
VENEQFYKITYTNVLTGLRETYMRIGFNSQESAVNEKNRILREAKRLRKQHIDVRTMKGLIIPSYLIGKNWRISKWKMSR